MGVVSFVAEGLLVLRCDTPWHRGIDVRDAQMKAAMGPGSIGKGAWAPLSRISRLQARRPADPWSSWRSENIRTRPPQPPQLPMTTVQNTRLSTTSRLLGFSSPPPEQPQSHPPQPPPPQSLPPQSPPPQSPIPMATVHQQQPQSVFPKSHVGFDSITQQIERKLLKRGFQFNVICVGKTPPSPSPSLVPRRSPSTQAKPGSANRR